MCWPGGVWCWVGCRALSVGAGLVLGLGLACLECWRGVGNCCCLVRSLAPSSCGGGGVVGGGAAWSWGCPSLWGVVVGWGWWHAVGFWGNRALGGLAAGRILLGCGWWCGWVGCELYSGREHLMRAPRVHLVLPGVVWGSCW